MRVVTYKSLFAAYLACLLLSLATLSVRAQNPPASGNSTMSPEKQALGRELLETEIQATVKTEEKPSKPAARTPQKRPRHEGPGKRLSRMPELICANKYGLVA